MDTKAIFINEWAEVLRPITETEYFENLLGTLKEEYTHHKVYPKSYQVFRAFNLTDFKDVKLVIIGQDPYHTPNMANGLAFSVNEGMRMPPSLRNIYKEMEDDIGVKARKTDLTPLARQGVLLLNTSLSVRQGEAMSHKFLMWEKFTGYAIEELGKREDIVFVLWGAHAQKLKPLIKHKENIIESVHPSPLSASRGFFGSKPFSKINKRLSELGRETIDFKVLE